MGSINILQSLDYIKTSTLFLVIFCLLMLPLAIFTGLKYMKIFKANEFEKNQGFIIFSFLFLLLFFFFFFLIVGYNIRDLNVVNFLQSLDYIKITTLFLVTFGVVMLSVSIFTVLKFMRVLTANQFDKQQWIIIIVLIFFFIIGYSVHALDVFEVFALPVPPALMVSLIYFFGAVFVVKAMTSIKAMIKLILGELLTDEKAYEIFLNRAGASKEDFPNLYNEFSIECTTCKQKVTYTMADVVKQHSNMGDKGVVVQNTFGVKSIELRHNHQCLNGRREITIVHDGDLAYRA